MSWFHFSSTMAVQYWQGTPCAVALPATKWKVGHSFLSFLPDLQPTWGFLLCSCHSWASSQGMEAPDSISDSNCLLLQVDICLLNLLVSFLLFELLFMLAIIVSLSENISCIFCIVFVVQLYALVFKDFRLMGEGKFCSLENTFPFDESWLSRLFCHDGLKIYFKWSWAMSFCCCFCYRLNSVLK